MPFAAWWRGDPIPALAPLPGFTARRVLRREEGKQITGLAEDRILQRDQHGHRLYAAFLSHEPAGFGWAATQAGGIEELDFSFVVPEGDCYLWDFVTLPPWRGRGVYPHLLQAILSLEDDVERFWIGYEAHNEASARGIAKAGFGVVGDLLVEQGRVTGFSTIAADEAPDPGLRARAAADLFDVPILADTASRPTDDMTT